jgi:DNA-binding transcriptional LysR family regulator
MDQLDLLQMFARIVETGSLTAVARETGLTQPAVSKRLQQLERSFGTKLLLRNTQGVRATEAGDRLYREGKALLDSFETLRTSVSDNASGSVTGKLMISAPMTFGAHVLARLMVDFHALHPQLKVELNLNNRVVDLIEDGVDVAVRMGTVRSPEVVARKLGMLEALLVATPAYLKRAGTPRRMEDLLEHQYLLPDVSGEELLLQGEREFRFTPKGWLTTQHSGVVREAVLRSAGISTLSRYLVHEDLEAGRLVEVLPGVSTRPMPISAVYLGGREAPEKVRALVRFLSDVFPKQPGISPAPP